MKVFLAIVVLMASCSAQVFQDERAIAITPAVTLTGNGNGGSIQIGTNPQQQQQDNTSRDSATSSEGIRLPNPPPAVQPLPPQPQAGVIQCQMQDTGSGNYKFVCDGANRESISLRSEHILWLQGPEGHQQVVDVEIPNYRIEELIQAGFKQGEGSSGTLINLLLRRPEQSYDAQVDQLDLTKSIVQPSVQLQYEPVTKTVVHYPTDKRYSPLQGPLTPPGEPRASRQAGIVPNVRRPAVAPQPRPQRQLVQQQQRWQAPSQNQAFRNVQAPESVGRRRHA